MRTTIEVPYPPDLVASLEAIQRRVLWLCTYMVHHANRIRPNLSGVKVGGHQASSSSVVTAITLLYFDILKAADRVSIKPHASPAFHACQYLLGNLDRRFLTELRSFEGLQSYPSRTKDPDPVDFSTGSMGLGSVAPNFAAFTERMVADRFGRRREGARFISLLGDGELDEGSIWETVAEPSLVAVDNVTWIVDLNRQSLDRVVPGIRVRQLQEMFAANGWNVTEAKYGRRLQGAFSLPGGESLRRRIDDMENDEYQRLLRAEGPEVRVRLAAGDGSIRNVLAGYADGDLVGLLGDLGGHDFGVLGPVLRAAVENPSPTVVFAYTVKGWGLPMAGDPLNHSALLSDEQIEQLRLDLDIPAGGEWDGFAPGTPERAFCDEASRRLERAPGPGRATADAAVPASLDDPRYGVEISTQQAFARALAALPRAAPDLASRVVTTSPDVATSTSLGTWINRVGVYSPIERPDVFSDAGPRILGWNEGPGGQHVELGISETNLFLMLGALGLSFEWFDEMLFPIGTLYDPFIARGLDALTYGLYSESRFIVVATPSGVTLGPEGGAHQSIITPSIGIELPGLTYWEPCFARETEWILLEALRQLTLRGQGRSSYLRLSTKPVDQSLAPQQLSDELRSRVLSGAYSLTGSLSGSLSGLLSGTSEASEVTIVSCGAMVPVAAAAAEALRAEGIQASVVNAVSPGLLQQSYHRWTKDLVRDEAGSAGSGAEGWSHPAFDRSQTPLVTVVDGHPHTLSWLGSALGRPTISLGVDDFGRSGAPDDLWRYFGIDETAIARACRVALTLVR